MPNNGIVYLLKFAPREAYIDDLINGRLYMNAADYYHGLPGEQGDPLEASMVLPACIYGNYRLCPSTACIRSTRTTLSTTASRSQCA